MLVLLILAMVLTLSFSSAALASSGPDSGTFDLNIPAGPYYVDDTLTISGTFAIAGPDQSVALSVNNVAVSVTAVEEDGEIVPEKYSFSTTLVLPDVPGDFVISFYVEKKGARHQTCQTC